MTETSAEYDFGRQVVFRLGAVSQAEITAATLFLETGDEARTEVIEAEFAPSRQITAEVTRNLQQEPLAPFSTIVYWWQVTDGAGAQAATEHASLLYEDNRFEWQIASRGPVTVHWSAGDLAFGQAAADIGALALPDISHDIGAPPPEKVDVYIYPSVTELQAGLELNGRSWIAGHADPALGVVLVASPPGVEALLALERDIPHELTHIHIYQATAPNYDAVPQWLNEGLAVLHEGQPNPTYRIVLDGARSAGQLLPLVALCGPFPSDTSEATLAYAESLSVAGYVRDRWGSDKIVQLLQAYADGASCEGGVQRALQTTVAGLQTDWERDALSVNPLGSIVASIGPWLLVFLIPFAALAFLLFVPRRHAA